MKRQLIGLALALAAGTLAAVGVAAVPGFASHPAGLAARLGGQSAGGSTRTLLPDGRVLAIGEVRGSFGGAEILGQDAAGAKQGLALAIPRHWHTATALPDGRVLVWGGVDGGGRLVAQAEWFDPETRRFSAGQPRGLTPRAGHTATVLTDGRVLLAGGLDAEGVPLASAELYDPASARIEKIPAPPGVGRRATLTAGGLVALQDGFDGSGQRLGGGLLFDPHTQRFTAVSLAELVAALRPPPAPGAQIMESLPGPGTKAVPLGGRLALRFSAPMNPATLNAETLSLLGPQGTVAVRVHPAEDGRLVFVTPEHELLPESFYALYAKGLKSAMGEKLPMAAIDFDTETLAAGGGSAASSAKAMAPAAPVRSPLTALTGSTAALPVSPAQARAAAPGRVQALAPKTGTIEDGIWHPGQDTSYGRWRANRPLLPLPKFEQMHRSLPEHATAVFGQVLQIDDQPIAGVEVSIGAQTARTDAQGLFVLVDPPAGRQELYIDGSAAGYGRYEYGQILMGLDVRAGRITPLSQPVYLPKIAPGDRIAIDSPTKQDVVLTQPELPGLEIHIPAGTVIRDHKGRIVHELSLVPVPLDRAPYPVPAHFPTYFSLQPGGATVLGITPQAAQGLRVVYPNAMHARPGSVADFWVYDPQLGWKTYGRGRVSRDGAQVVPDAGVALYAEMGAGYDLGNGVGTPGPVSCGDGGAAAAAGKPCDLATGRFDEDWTDFYIDDVIPLELTRRYHQGDQSFGLPTDPSYGYASEPFGPGMNFNYGYQLVGVGCNNYDVIELVLPNGVGVPFSRTSGSGPGGSWKNTIGVSRYYGAVISSGGGAPEGYYLSLADGTQYSFGGGVNLPNVLTAIRDRFGNTLTLSYTGGPWGLPSRITSPSGRYLNLSYDGNGHVTQVSDYTGRTVHYSYNTSGTLAQASYPDGTSWQYTYDGGTHSMLTVEDRRGNTVTSNQYDGGALAVQTLADGATYRFSYVFPEYTQLYGGDGGGGGGGGGSGGNIAPPVCALPNQVTGPGEATLPTLGIAISAKVTDPLGIVRALSFDLGGNPVSDTYGYGQADAQTWSYQRDRHSGYPNQVTDPLGRTSAYSYDSYGNLTGLTLLAGTANAVSYSYSYDAQSDLTAATDPLGHTTTLSYTGGCLTGVTNALGQSLSLTCNAAGQPTSVTDSLGRTVTYSYAGPELAGITDPMGRSTVFQRDALGRVLSVTDAQGNVSLASYDSNDRLISASDPLGNLYQYAYDGDGDLTSFTDPAGGVIGFGYDGRNRPTSRTDALGRSETASYDGLGNLLSATDRLSQATQAAYDDLGRLHQVTYADSSTATYAYDAGDRVTGLVDSQAGSTSLSYDGLDRPIQVTTAQGTIGYGYDAAGRRTSMQVQGQSATSYAYDAGDRITALTNATETVGYTYDNANRRTGLSLPNGVTVAYSYDNDDELTALAYANANGSLGSLNYAYNALGQVTQTTGSLASDRLSQATTAGFGYSAADRLTGYDGYTPQYDLQGQMTQDGQGIQYTWNVRHQLTQIANGTAIIASFQYDAFGRRTQKSVNGASTGYLYDGSDPVQEQQGSSLNNILTGPGVDERYARTDTIGRLYYLTDALGSTIALTDAAGNVQQQYQYDPYGGYGTTAQGTFTNPYTYTGREDDGTGLYYYRARYYSPALSQFVSEDPAGLGGGPNGYAYADGDPILFVDPNGNLASLPQGLVDFSAAFGDTISWNATNGIRNLMDTNGVVNKCSGAYAGGTAAGVVWGLTWGGATAGRYAANVGARTFLSDSRAYSTVQKIWSKSVGGYKGRYELHHWFTPQSLGGTSAGWNLVAVSPWLNSAMGEGGMLYNAFRASMIAGYLGAAGTVPTAIASSQGSGCSCGN